MQIPPLTLTDTSLLIAIGAIILLVTLELSETRLGQTNLVINRENLRKLAHVMLALLLIIITVDIVFLILSPQN